MAQFGASSARTREAESGPLASDGTSDPRLFLGQASVDPGSSFMRADLLLHHDGGGFSSGGYAAASLSKQREQAMTVLPLK